MTIETELKNTLARFNRGVRGVTVEYGIVCVSVKSAKAATGVTLDMLRSGGFRSVKPTADNINGGFVVHGVPA